MSLRIVQLSDPHIEAADRQPVLGRNTITNLEKVVQAVNELSPQPDLVFLTGDQTNDDSEDSFEAVKHIIDDLMMPCHLALGNHDARLPFRQVMLGETEPSEARYHYVVREAGYRFIVLDTLDQGQVSGILDTPQLDWLEAELAQDNETFTSIFMHHPPMPVGVAWMDAIILQAPERLLGIIDDHACVRLVLCGHVHHSFDMTRSSTVIMSAPAVSVQFRTSPLPPPTEKPFSLFSDDPPAFRIIDLNGDEWTTELYHLPA